ncbi:sigma-70 family RNA polymerase sigma factor [Micromonospora sp. NPDC005215]|uniref:RNA polymerase sigma factor n=1 Tax=Micromonospora sp. NPDC005215 TaxID=3157024 RepID=UPI00339E0728
MSTPANRGALLAECLHRAQGGETDALDTVVREVNPLLWHVARGQGLTAEEAADVVQTTWLELLRRLQEIRSPQALTAWLVTTTRREAWRVRELSRRPPPEADAALPPASELDDRLLTDERDKALWRQVRRLPDRCQRLLRVLAQVDRPDYAVVADAMGMPRGSVGPTRGRCLAKLRELLTTDPVWSAR